MTTNTLHSAPAALLSVPAVVPNQIGGAEARARDGRTFAKIDPATGREICPVARSTRAAVQPAIADDRITH